MAGRSPKILRFRRDEPEEVVGAIAALRESRDGWVNFRPFDEELDGDSTSELHDEGGGGRNKMARGSALGIGGLLLRPAPAMPESTWVPGEDHRRKGRLPDSVGLHHPAGKKAGPSLVAEGVTLPTGWKVVSDNARRGLVLSVPTDADAHQAVQWLLRAATILTPFDLPAEWIAEVHRR